MVRRKDGYWQERVNIDGKIKYVYGKSKSEVTLKIKKLFEQGEQRYYFSNVAAEWREESSKVVAISTAHGYDAAYKSAIKYFGDKPIDSITPQDILVYLNCFQKKGFTTKTILTYKLVLSLIYKFAIINNMVKSSPVDHIKVPKGKDSTPREIPSDEVIQKVLSDEWLLPIFIYYTGCRRGEVLALTYDDIDFERKTIRINKSVTYMHNKPLLKSTKTKNSNRVIPLLNELAIRLPRGEGLIFGYEGKMYNPDRFRSVWAAWRKRLGIELTPHQLRHAYATLCHDAGLDAKDAMMLLGHSDIQTTMNIYTHIDKKRQNEITEKLNKFTKTPDDVV